MYYNIYNKYKYLFINKEAFIKERTPDMTWAW